MPVNFPNILLKRLEKLRRSAINLSSLQSRLIIGTIGVISLGLSSLTVWTNWKMEQFLIVTHQQKVEAMANRFLQDAERYGTVLSIEIGMQQAIERVSLPNLQVWVMSADGKMMAESNNLATLPARSEPTSISIKQISSQPQVYKVKERQLVLYSGILQSGSKTLGQLYIQQDITHDYTMFKAAIQNLRTTTLLVLVTIALVFSLLIWRSLLPLRQMSQWMETYPAQLHEIQYNWEKAPSEVKQIAKKWNRLFVYLAENREQQRQFTNNIAHELRTPLSLVYGYLQRTLRRSDNLTAAQQEALSIATSETERTIKLLQDLLDLTRATNSYLPFQLEVLRLNDLVVDVARMAEKFEHWPIEIEVAPLPVIVKADRDALMQVLTHLINNAIKHSSDREPITVKLGQTDGWAVIQVCDKGCGIPLVGQEGIFEPFRQVDASPSVSTEEVSLGLSIANSLANAMGGRVTIQSTPGQGSIFSVVLPLHSTK